MGRGERRGKMGTLISIVGIVVFLWIKYKQDKGKSQKEKEREFMESPIGKFSDGGDGSTGI